MHIHVAIILYTSLYNITCTMHVMRPKHHSPSLLVCSQVIQLVFHGYAVLPGQVVYDPSV